MSRFLRNAEEIFATARAAAGDDCDLMLLVDGDGAIRATVEPGWSLDALRRMHGASAAYRVRRTGARVRLEGATATERCLLETDVARRPASCRPLPLTLQLSCPI